MKTIISELRKIINEFTIRMGQLGDLEFSVKPSANRWSKKETVGHLIDSAQNNLRRFIVGQYETTPSQIVYDQNFWVTANNYQSASKEDVITLWRLINERIAAVLENMPKENYSKVSLRDDLQTLEWLADDYVKHLKHHLNQIIPGSFSIIYRS